MQTYAPFLLISCIALGCQDHTPVSVTHVTSVIVQAPEAIAAPNAEPPEIPVPRAVDAGERMSRPPAAEDMATSTPDTEPAAPTEQPRTVANATPLWTDGAQESNPWADGAGTTPGWTNGASQTNGSTAGATVGMGPTPGWTNGASGTNHSSSGATVRGVSNPGWTTGSGGGAQSGSGRRSH
jgi:hypothetical protein